MPSINQFMLCCEFRLHYPWPAKEQILLHEANFSDGKITLTAEPSGTVAVRVFDKTGTILKEAHSCRLICNVSTTAKLAVRWKHPNDMGIAINGAIVFSEDQANPSVESLEIHKKSPTKIDQTLIQDLEEKNRASMQKRGLLYERSRNQPHRKNNSITATTEEIKTALKNELYQLGDILDAIKNGNLHHVPGLSRCLRMLIAIGDPLPLLQLYAAATQLPLLIYTNLSVYNKPELLDGAHAEVGMRLSIKDKPIDDENMCIDLDEWLELPAIYLGTYTLSNKKLLTDIGHKIGAHFDQNIPHSIALLRSFKSEPENVEVTIDFITEFLGTVGEAIVKMGNKLLELPSPKVS